MNGLATEDLIPDLTPAQVDMLRARWGRCYAGVTKPTSGVWPGVCVTHDAKWKPGTPMCDLATNLKCMATDILRVLYPTVKDQVNREWRRRIERLGGVVPRFCDIPGCHEFGAYAQMVAGGTWIDLCRCHALQEDGGSPFTA